MSKGQIEIPASNAHLSHYMHRIKVIVIPLLIFTLLLTTACWEATSVKKYVNKITPVIKRLTNIHSMRIFDFDSVPTILREFRAMKNMSDKIQTPKAIEHTHNEYSDGLGCFIANYEQWERDSDKDRFTESVTICFTTLDTAMRKIVDIVERHNIEIEGW